MGSGFESQGAHFKENPADSSESAGFLRSLNFIDFGLRCILSSLLLTRLLGKRYSPSFLQGTRPRFASDTLMSLRAIPSFLGWLPGAAAEDICTSARIGIRGTLWSRRGCGRCAGVLCAPRAWRTGAGEGCRGLVCCLVAGRLGWCAVFSGSALRVSHGRSPQRSKEKRSVRVTGAPA